MEGQLFANPTSFNEHMIPKVGKNGFDTYLCTQEQEECPICEDGDRPSLVMPFTIIDHRQLTDKKGVVHAMEKRLFLCKRDTFKLLQTKAAKIGGLVGVTFDVMRIGEKAPSVGSSFDYLATSTIAEIAGFLQRDPKELEPFNYEEIVKSFSASELRKMGFGSPAGVGSHDTAALNTTSKPNPFGGVKAPAATANPFGGGEKANSGSPFGPFNPSKQF